jgi:hypothetical protein
MGSTSIKHGKPDSLRKLYYFDLRRYKEASLKDLSEEDLKSLKDSPMWCYKFCRSIFKKPVPELEPYILTSPLFSQRYAQYVLKSRWPEAEDIISTDSKASFKYAVEVVKGRFEKGELKIILDPYYKPWYTKFLSRKKSNN